ncbi:hypothetical protein RB195_000489 [Necator americanus]|uniref:Uncharacterized protein n=1 Tax=Necator americanus TaxID=51031 RepID=A0ABR1DAK0_NECAM
MIVYGSDGVVVVDEDGRMTDGRTDVRTGSTGQRGGEARRPRRTQNTGLCCNAPPTGAARPYRRCRNAKAMTSSDDATSLFGRG